MFDEVEDFACEELEIGGDDREEMADAFETMEGDPEHNPDDFLDYEDWEVANSRYEDVDEYDFGSFPEF